MAPSQGLHETGWVLRAIIKRNAVWEANAIPVLAGEVLYADVLLLPNGMSKVGAYE